MKFGDTLLQRSPQWRTYNIDYAGIKQLIKEHTSHSGDKGKAVSIPGTGRTAEADFERRLFLILSDEHDRVSLFVKSKVYEISSRLRTIGKQMVSASRRRNAAVAQALMPLRTRQQLSRIESDILAVGFEMQHLSRFIGTNRMGFRKLVKKYQKWSHSSALAPKVEEQIFAREESFTRIRLRMLLDRYTVYLDEVRLPFEQTKAHDSVDSFRTASEGSAMSTASSEFASLFGGSGVEFDSALAILPIAKRSRTRTYWVHQDNLVELRVLLLQHLRYARKAPEEGSSSATAGSLSEMAIEREDNVGLLALGNAKDIVYQYSEAKNPEDARPAILRARWAGNGDAVVTLPDSSGGSIQMARLKSKELPQLLKQPDHDEATPKDEAPISASTAEQDKVRRWIHENPSVAPLVQLRFSRSRFVGLNNTSQECQWAALDEDVQMASACTTPADATRGRPSLFRLPSQHQNFPHALLHVRCEGSATVLINVLDESHLTERVPGFIIEVHAIACCVRPAGMTTSPWTAALEKDIRHVPSDSPTAEKPSRRSSAFGTVPGSASNSRSRQSGSATPPGPTTNPQVEPLEKPRRPRLNSDARLKLMQAPAARTKYWNEYDFPQSEAGADEGFVVYIDPDAPAYPGQKMFQRWNRNLRNLFSKKERVPDVEGQSPTSDPLSPSTSSSEDGRGDGQDRAKQPLLRTTPGKLYGTTPTAARTDPENQYMILTPSRLSTTCFFLPLIILLYVTILNITTRHRYRQQVDAGIIAGAVMSVLIVLIGVARLVHDGGHIGIVRMLVAGSMTAVVCIWAVCTVVGILL